jgi:hypothetical protein
MSGYGPIRYRLWSGPGIGYIPLQRRSVVNFFCCRIWTSAKFACSVEGMAAVPRYRPGRGRMLITRAPCLYPGCRRVVDERPAGGGRQRLFCGQDCRANFANIQRQLTSAAAQTHESMEVSEDPGQRATLARNLELTEWHLLRFPELRSPRLASARLTGVPAPADAAVQAVRGVRDTEPTEPTARDPRAAAQPGWAPPVEVPEDLTEMRGEIDVVVHLPGSVYSSGSGPARGFNLAHENERIEFYEIVLTNATAAQITEYLNVNELIRLWPKMWLPPHVVRAWVDTIPFPCRSGKSG